MVELWPIVSALCLFFGCVINLIAGLGIFRFPDVYTRMHASGITDSLGTALILVGLMLQGGWDGPIGKLFIILIFTLITSPTISYVLGNTAMREQLPYNNKKDAHTIRKHSDKTGG